MSVKKITSVSNPRVKAVVKLRDQKSRLKSGLTVVEGVREITRALEAGVMFEELFVNSDNLDTEKSGLVGTILEKVRKQKSTVYETSRSVQAKLSYGDREEGILGVCAIPERRLADLPLNDHPLLVLVEGVEKPGNLGAILRTCDAAGVDGVMICDGKTDIYNPNTIRASLGTVFTVPCVACTNMEAHEFLKTRQIPACAAQLQAETVYTQEIYQGPVAVVFGSEHSGLTGFWTQHADKKVRIPMRGRADSLNVSAATAILLYEIIRQRSL